MADDEGPVILMSSDSEKFEVEQEVALCVHASRESSARESALERRAELSSRAPGLSLIHI